MKKGLKNLIKSILFVVLLVGSLYFINKVLEPKFHYGNSNWPSTSAYRQFYQLPENSVDVLFLGSSVAVNGFIPQELYNAYGITSYNLGSEQQSPVLSYFWLKEALRFQSPKVVIWESNFASRIHPEYEINTSEPLTRKCLDPMRYSSVKKEAVRTICGFDSTQSELSYYLTNIRFHNRWTEMTEQDFMQKQVDSAELFGYYPVLYDAPNEYNPFEPGDLQDTSGADERMLEYVRKMQELCRENGIQFVIVSFPGTYMNDGVNNALGAMGEEENTDYYNFCLKENYDLLKAELPKENTTNHANIWGAVKFTDYMGELLSGEYGVAPRKEDCFEKEKPYLERTLKACEMETSTDVATYMQLLKDSDYAALGAVEGYSDWLNNPSSIALLKEFGLDDSFGHADGDGFVAALQYQKESKALSGRDPQALKGRIDNTDAIYSVESYGIPGSKECKIEIDGVDYALHQNGLNVVVYDTVRHRVVDSIVITANGLSR
jgi:hypothetical protein